MMLKVTEFLCRLRFALTALTAGKKKAGVFVLLFFIAAGVFMPKTTNAMGVADTAVAATLLIGPYLAYYVAYILAIVSAEIFQFFWSELISAAGPITRDAVFQSAWFMVKNIANILIVLTLVTIALATILRLKEYEAKKLLIPLLIVALVVNFSNVFVGIFIDTGNIVMRGLDIKDDSAKKIVDKAVKNADKVIKVEWVRMLSQDTSGWNSQSWIKLFAAVNKMSIILGEFIVIFLLLAVGFLVFLVVMTMRYAILAFLFIISPLAFICRIIPIEAAKKLWNDWWHTFLKWSFVGVGITFCLWLSLEVFESLGGIPEITNVHVSDSISASSAAVIGASAVAPGVGIFVGIARGIFGGGAAQFAASSMAASPISPDGASTAQTVQTIYRLMVVIIILLIGIKMSIKVSGKMAEMTIGLAKKATMMAVTGGAVLGKKLGGFIADRSGLKRGWENVKNKATQFAEKIPLVGAGRGAAARQKEENLKRSRAKTGSDERMAAVPATEALDVANSRAAAGDKGRNDKMAATERMIKEGKGHLLKEEALDWHAGQTGKTAIYSQAGPRHAGKDKDKINDLTTTGRAKNEAEATKMVIGEAYRRLDDSDIQKMSRGDLADLSKKKDDKSGMAAKARERMIKEGWQDDIEKNPEELAKMLNSDKEIFGSGGIGMAARNDHRIAGYDEDALLEVKKSEIRERDPNLPNEDVERQARAMGTSDAHKEKAKQSAAERISADKAVDLASDVQEDWARRSSDEQLDKFLKNRRVTEKGKRAALKGVIKGDERGNIDSKKLNKFSAEDIAKNLEAEPKYTREEMAEAENEFRAANPGTVTVSNTLKRRIVKKKHAAKLGRVANSLDAEKLRGVMENAETNLQEEMAKSIVQDVADSASTMTPEQFAGQLPEINNKLLAIPEPQMEHALGALNPTARAGLRDKLLRRGAPPVTERVAEQKDVEEAERDKLEDVEKLVNDGHATFGGVSHTAEQLYNGDALYRQALQKRKDAIAPKTNKAEQMKDIEQLRGEGFMPTAEKIDEYERSGLGTKSLEEYYKEAVQKKSDSIEPVKIPVRGTTIPLKPEEQKEAEQHFDNSDVEAHWQRLSKEDKERLEEVLRRI